MWKTRMQLREERDQGWRVADKLREDNLTMHRKLVGARELAKSQILKSGHGERCPCRLCGAARITLGLAATTEQFGFGQ